MRSRRRHFDPRGGGGTDTARGILVVVILGVAVFTFLSWLGKAGPAGVMLDRGVGALWGVDRMIVPLLLLVLAALIAAPGKFRLRTPATIGFILFVLALQGTIHLIRFPLEPQAHAPEGGGYLGLFLAYPLASVTGFAGALTILVVLLASSILLTLEAGVAQFLVVPKFILTISRGIAWPLTALIRVWGRKTKTLGIDRAEPGAVSFSRQDVSEGEVPEPSADAMLPITKSKKSRRTFRHIELSLDLLTPRTNKPSAGDVRRAQEVIGKTLANFGIDIEMGEVSVGPTVTQYTFKPAEGIKLSRITALGNDLALALAAHPIRIEAPIPGKSLVGIEVPNETIATVGLREILESDPFLRRGSSLTIALGKDVAGASWVAPLDRMPHLLVAGATGSGKTVSLNTIIVSLLYQNGPDRLRFILIDPKRVELPAYNGIPHLLAPVITDVPKTVNALKWTLGEMERRFAILASSGKRDIASYNQEANGEGMPYLIVVIDELADLMVAAASEVEGAIIRLAQMSRAVGIHLIVATQRPSVDILTGLIKANITSRMAFAVPSSTDSRTILDTAGAEKLLGRGDMLFTSAELSKPKRLQGAFVGDDEIARVVTAIKSQSGEPDYRDEITVRQMPGAQSAIPGVPSPDEDPLLEDAKQEIRNAGKASASLLQRRLSVGYARAARLLDILESQGFIGPGEGAKPREVLTTGGEEDMIAEDEGGDQDE